MAGNEPIPQTFDDFAVWRTPLCNAQHAVLPPLADSPNPRLFNGILFASVFSPGCVCALDPSSGQLFWRRELPYLGSSAVEASGEVLFAKTAQGLYALDPATGKTRWEFIPYGSEAEMLYSRPALDGKRLFIGDRQGWLHCLNADTGEAIWKTAAEDGSDVNATATVVAGLVITATNAGFFRAYSAEYGEPVWQTKLDGPCINQLFLVKGRVVVAAESLYFLEQHTGELVERVGWPGFGIAFAAGTDSRVALFRQESRNRQRAPEEEAAKYTTMLLYDGQRLLREVRCTKYARAVRYSRVTGLLCASGLGGIDVINAETGGWIQALHLPDAVDDCGLPDISTERIYAIDGQGAIWGLRHPPIP